MGLFVATREGPSRRIAAEWTGDVPKAVAWRRGWPGGGSWPDVVLSPRSVASTPLRIMVLTILASDLDQSSNWCGAGRSLGWMAI